MSQPQTDTQTQAETPQRSRFRNYVWNEYEVDPIDLIGQTARIEVTYYAESPNNGKRNVKQVIISGTIREIVENRGQALIDPSDSAEDASDGSNFQKYGTTKIFTDHGHEFEFAERDHVVITVLNRS